MYTMKDIIREGHPTLRKVTNEVSLPLSKEDIQLMNDMLDFIKNSQDPVMAKRYRLRESIGLAAPQLNLDKRVIAIHTRDELGRLHSMALANPKIISHSKEKIFLSHGEGCLSVDRIVLGLVPRYRHIVIQGYNVRGELVKLAFHDYMAIIIQHEMDHLDGVLFIDRIDHHNPMKVTFDAKPIKI